MILLRPILWFLELIGVDMNKRPLVYHVKQSRRGDWSWKCVSGNGRCVKADKGFDTVKIALHSVGRDVKDLAVGTKYRVQVLGKVIEMGVR